MDLKVLIIEDSENDALLLLRALRKGGYEPIYRRVQTDKAMRAALQEQKWDLVISDHEMPQFSAPAALAVLRKSGHDLPFIIVSGAIGEEMAVEVMKAGADDFIKKGQLSRLIPAIKRELQEAENRLKRRKAEAALRQREQEFKALAENAPDIVARYDRGGRYLYVNPAMEKDKGIPRKAFIGRTNEELKLNPKAVKLLNDAFHKAFTTGSENTLYFDYVSPKGIKYYHARVVPEYGPAGMVETVLAITRDITELKKMEAEMQEELAKTKRLHLDSLPEFPVGLPGVAMLSHYRPGRQFKGDFYNLMQKEHKLIFYLADSRGNGLDGVMLSTFVQKTMAKYLKGTGVNGSIFSPQSMLKHLLQQYERENPGNKCPLSIFMSVLDTEANELRYAAHDFHCAPLLVTEGGDVVALDTVACSPLRDQIKSFVSASTLLIYSGGITKKYDASQPCTALIKDLLAAHRHEPPELILRSVNEALQLHAQTSADDEDITMLVLQGIANKQRLALEVESDFSVIEGTKKKVFDFFADHQATENDLFHFHEMLVNAIEHGNKQDGAKMVLIELTVTAAYYKIVIEDEGEGFNWRDRIKRELDFDNFNERGRGVIMTRMMTDYLGYNERGNRVTMIKRIDKEDGRNGEDEI